MYLAVRVLCGPDGLTGESDLLFHNRGDGTFEEVSQKAGVNDPGHRFGMQALWADFENDGWPDLYVANDTGANYLYRNKHDGSFEDIGLWSGAALTGDGRLHASMGVDVADFDHSGRYSIIVTDLSQEGAALFYNLGKAGFDDTSSAAGLLLPTYPYVGWGTAFFDMDNDGWSDIFVANGHAYPQMESVKGGVPYREPLLLFRNNRDRTFENVTGISGLDKLPRASRRGAAFGDVNNDGKIDILLLNVGESPTLLINRTQSSNHAVVFKLVGSKSNRAAIGARVTVTTGDMVQFNEVRGGSSYASQNDLRLHFGLGASARMNSVEIAWPSEKKESFHDLPADFIYTIVEDSGIERKVPFTGETGGRETPATIPAH